jgi:biotin/methionine sulfoxide reductase
MTIIMRPHSAHWGAFSAGFRDGRLVVSPHPAGAAAVILPHVFGTYEGVSTRHVTWDQIVAHTDMILSFGSMALKNAMVASGGVSRHVERDAMRQARQRGTAFVLISPLRNDLPDEAAAEWFSLRPGTDTALMLGIACVLVTENLHDRAFVDNFCTGWPQFEQYLLGPTPKTPAWAGEICGVSAADIAALARRLPGRRTLIVCAHAMQRAEHGEQPIWMAAVLAAMLGQIGLPALRCSQIHAGRRQAAPREIDKLARRCESLPSLPAFSTPRRPPSDQQKPASRSAQTP